MDGAQIGSIGTAMKHGFYGNKQHKLCSMWNILILQKYVLLIKQSEMVVTAPRTSQISRMNGFRTIAAVAIGRDASKYCLPLQQQQQQQLLGGRQGGGQPAQSAEA